MVEVAYVLRRGVAAVRRACATRGRQAEMQVGEYKVGGAVCGGGSGEGGINQRTCAKPGAQHSFMVGQTLPDTSKTACVVVGGACEPNDRATMPQMSSTTNVMAYKTHNSNYMQFIHQLLVPNGSTGWFP